MDLDNKPELEIFLEDLPSKAEKVMKKSKKEAPLWTIEDSENLYGIQGWGDPYFSINAAGHVTVSPQGDRGVVGSLDIGRISA